METIITFLLTFSLLAVISVDARNKRLAYLRGRGVGLSLFRTVHS